MNYYNLNIFQCDPVWITHASKHIFQTKFDLK